ncbi:3a4d98ff-1986-4f8b-a5db-052ce4667ebf [Sclerotinia trifoliorum]|uniref:3a4d98ff-1986-4f8b-a5db-052ce4667ebf n=1 Tax=Sclerotinia trifoliorum TaxID=28548 RepID=A0A8H2VL45_9HELO|nr:3a4d98ff-1986-4f8b-a5db-052ce4667ebf [Sclerotinia trifoliorum]
MMSITNRERMADRMNKVENRYPEDIQTCANNDDGNSYPADKDCDAESFLPTTTTQVAMTTRFPKLSYPGIIKRKLGSNHWDKIHEAIQGRKRDASECPTDYQLCPKSMNGGCCPNNRFCGTSSCYLTSAAPASACGVSGYTACGIDAGGGCCPDGYSCEIDGCSASPGVSYSETCGVGSYLCPSSLNYGCCMNGMGCGMNDCYSTAISTFTLTETMTTTDSNSNTQTLTSTLVTASTPASPSVAVNTSKASAVPKLTPTATAIAKVKATTESTSTPTSSGLTKPEIGGIIGGASFILLVILIAAFCILRRLKKATKAYKEAKSRSGSSVPRSHRHRPSYPSPSDMSSISFDPLQMSGSQSSQSVRNKSHPTTEPFSFDRHDGPEVVTRPIFNTYSPFSPHAYPNIVSQTQGRGYYPVATSESVYSQTSSGRRNPSVESTPPLQQPQSYFDIPPRQQSGIPDFRNQNLRHGHDVSPVRRPSQHGRNWSNASDVSASSSSPLVELEAGDDGEQKFSLVKAWKVLGIGGNWKGKVSTKRKHENLSLKDSPTSTLDRDLKTVLSNVPEEAGSFINATEAEADGDGDEIRVQRPKSSDTGRESHASRPRSGLSNAELREASIKNVVKAKPSKVKEIMIRNSGGASESASVRGNGNGNGNEKAEEAGSGG